MLKIVAESYALKGMSLEKLPPPSTSKYKIKEREDTIIKCYEKASELCLLYLQEVDRGQRNVAVSVSVAPSGQFVSHGDLMGPILETAIQRTPILYIKNGQLPCAIKTFRDLLRAVESRATQNLRPTLAKQLAEVLLRGICVKNYEKIDMADYSETASSPLPRKYSGERLFLPKDENEETILLLLIAECMANREAILTRSPEYQEAREHTASRAAAIYDLLTISLVRRAQTDLLSETFERAMKFSFADFHVWYQFALSLICSEKYARALLVLEECHGLQPENSIILLQMAQICYYHLHILDKGIACAKKVVELGDNQPMAARGYVALGIGYALKAFEAKVRGNRQELQKKALTNYSKAHKLDNNDHVALLHLALQLAIFRKIPEAIKYVRQALKLKYDHVHSLHLLSLLLSAQKHCDEALVLIEAALDEYPDNLSLMLTKSKLEQICLGTDEALMTCKHMLYIWKQYYQPSPEFEQRGTGLIDRVTADKRTLAQLQLAEMSDRDSGSVRAESIAASRVEQALSEVASSMNNSIQPRQGPSQAWSLQAQIWLHLAELYLTVNNDTEAMACVKEASSIFPLNHQVAFMKGRIHEHRMEYHEAKKCYDNAVSINPGNIKSLQHLGIVLHHLGQNRLAEKVLRDAVNIDPTSSQSWNCLGEVLQTLGEGDASSECLFTAVDLEATDPIVPFQVIPRLMQ
ncbi:tetratricopeptide repeat protein 7B-like isoform X2 [Tubulanus polymorphus]|uniref:tetratricopeptide repeat protein 7B-like isoform X2 n=1 Tax=Tubulanus polymorphus TaxID=672921 RepID=UPI003DA4F8F3